MVDMEQRPNVFPGAPGSPEPRSGMKGLIVLIIILLLVIVGAGVWYFYSAKVAQAPVSAVVKPVPLIGELDFYSSAPIALAGKTFISGILKYTATDGVTGVISQSFTTPFVSAALSPLRDQIALVSQSTSSTPTQGSTLSLYSLVTRKTTVVTQSKNPILNVIWSGDGSTLAFLELSQANGSTTVNMLKIGVNGKNPVNMGAGIPIALSYDGTNILYDNVGAQLYIESSSTPGVPVSEKLSFPTPQGVTSSVSFAASPDRQYVAIMGNANTYLARVDWTNTKLINPTMLPTAYESGVFDQKDELLLAKNDGTADPLHS